MVYRHSYAFFKPLNVEVYWNRPINIPDEAFVDGRDPNKAFNDGTDNKESIQKNQKILTVPRETKSLYEEAPGWGNFATIIERLPTAISSANIENFTVTSVSKDIYIETKEMLPVAIYNLFGQRIFQTILNGSTVILMETGIYIVKANGKGIRIVFK
jgi:hypothetical protein